MFQTVLAMRAVWLPRFGGLPQFLNLPPENRKINPSPYCWRASASKSQRFLTSPETRRDDLVVRWAAAFGREDPASDCRKVADCFLGASWEKLLYGIICQ